VTEPHTTQAGDWWAARLRGERLPEHEIHCDLCGESYSRHEFSEAALDASGMNVCGQCLEAMLDETAFNARAEVGLVGSGGGRS
jgi:hypothetical protein